MPRFVSLCGAAENKDIEYARNVTIYAIWILRLIEKKTANFNLISCIINQILRTQLSEAAKDNSLGVSSYLFISNSYVYTYS